MTRLEREALYASLFATCGRDGFCEAARRLCASDLYFLLTKILGRKDLERDWLYERCAEVQAAPDGYLDLWAREHYKSTIITFGKTIQDVLVDPEITVGIFSFNRPIAKAFLRQIKREFESNETLRELFPDVLWTSPGREAPKWSEDEGIIVRRKGNPKEATVEAWGLVDGQPTSKHYSLVVYDDVVTRESVTTPEMIAKVHAETPLKRLVVASPANPSGTMMTREGLRDLVAACRDMGISLVMDEIYHGLVYAGSETTALEFADDIVVVNSFSKYYCMTGWRIGWMVLPEAMVRPVERIAQNLFISPSELSQWAALGAFAAIEELEAVKAGYAASRALLLERLPAIGLDRFLPVDGAFYLYADVSRFTNDSRDFARAMLEEAGVAATPGLDFDTQRGQAYLRFSFAGGPDAVTEACDRLARWLR